MQLLSCRFAKIRVWGRIFIIKDVVINAKFYTPDINRETPKLYRRTLFNCDYLLIANYEFSYIRNN